MCRSDGDTDKEHKRNRNGYELKNMEGVSNTLWLANRLLYCPHYSLSAIEYDYGLYHQYFTVFIGV